MRFPIRLKICDWKVSLERVDVLCASLYRAGAFSSEGPLSASCSASCEVNVVEPIRRGIFPVVSPSWFYPSCSRERQTKAVSNTVSGRTHSDRRSQASRLGWRASVAPTQATTNFGVAVGSGVLELAAPSTATPILARMFQPLPTESRHIMSSAYIRDLRRDSARTVLGVDPDRNAIGITAGLAGIRHECRNADRDEIIEAIAQ